MTETVITIRGLVNRFGRQTVHDGLDLDVYKGEILGIVGGSGSGKTVLLRSILGLHQPQAGTIRVRGKPPAFYAKQPQRTWGVLFQNGALFSALTVRENVEFPISLHSNMTEKMRRELAELKIMMSGLTLDASDKYPSQLSGGMRKRAGLARALALEPRILFLDEPTAGLDPIGASELDELVVYLKEKLDLTVVMISHDVDSLFSICDRLAALVDGKVIAGTADEIAQDDNPWVQNYFNNRRSLRARGKA